MHRAGPAPRPPSCPPGTAPCGAGTGSPPPGTDTPAGATRPSPPRARCSAPPVPAARPWRRRGTSGRPRSAAAAASSGSVDVAPRTSSGAPSTDSRRVAVGSGQRPAGPPEKRRARYGRRADPVGVPPSHGIVPRVKIVPRLAPHQPPRRRPAAPRSVPAAAPPPAHFRGRTTAHHLARGVDPAVRPPRRDHPRRPRRRQPRQRRLQFALYGALVWLQLPAGESRRRRSAASAGSGARLAPRARSRGDKLGEGGRKSTAFAGATACGCRRPASPAGA
jgi:hypothetical protein